MFISIKYRIYPNKEQIDLINKTIGCTRLVYNLMLHDFYINKVIKTPANIKMIILF